MEAEWGRELPKINYVANDQIWKDHVWKEEDKANTWDENWGFMKGGVLKNQDKEPNSLESEEQIDAAIQIKPVTPLEEYVHCEPSPKPVPETTAKMVGWRSGSKNCILEKYGKYAKPKGGLVKQMGWPEDAE